MAAANDKLAQLKTYLGSVPVEVREKLINGIERQKLAGQSSREFDVLLPILRSLMAPEEKPVRRFGAPTRTFWTFLDPYIQTFTDTRKQEGRIPRSALMPIWEWMNRDLLPDQLPDLIDQARELLLDDKAKEAQELVERSYGLLTPVLDAAIKACATPEDEQKLADHIGGKNMFAHVRNIRDALKIQPRLAILWNTLPDQVSEPSEQMVKEVAQQILMVTSETPSLVPIFLAAIPSRLKHPATAVVVARKMVGSRKDADLAASDMAFLVETVIFDLGIEVRRIEEMAEGKAFDEPLREALKDYANAGDFIAGAIDIDAASDWSRRLSDQRAAIATAVTPVVENVPAKVRDVFEPLKARPIVKRPDKLAIEEIRETLDFIVVMDKKARYLALDKLFGLIRAQVDGHIELANGHILEAIRRAKTQDEGQLGLSYLYAAVEIAELMNGAEFGRVIRRLGEAAYADTRSRLPLAS